MIHTPNRFQQKNKNFHEHGQTHSRLHTRAAAGPTGAAVRMVAFSIFRKNKHEKN